MSGRPRAACYAQHSNLKHHLLNVGTGRMKYYVRCYKKVIYFTNCFDILLQVEILISVYLHWLTFVEEQFDTQTIFNIIGNSLSVT